MLCPCGLGGLETVMRNGRVIYDGAQIQTVAFEETILASM
jgi:hypothetical protein